MTRWIVPLGGLAALAILLAYAFFLGRDVERGSQMEDTLETRERIDEALSDCSGRHWSDRLFCND